MIRQDADIAQTRAQTDLINLQKQKVLEESRGIKINNDFAMASYPDRLANVALERSLAEIRNPITVEKMLQELKKVNAETANKNADTKLKQLEIPAQVLENIKKEVDISFAQKGVDIRTKELIAKQIAIESAQRQLDMEKSLGGVSKKPFFLTDWGIQNLRSLIPFTSR